MSQDEIFPLVDERGNVIGKATRKECHSGSKLLHPVVHLHIFSIDGKSLYLQRRSLDKDIQPGKWDTAVGGHVDYGESTIDALHRETREELGLTGIKAEKLFSYPFESKVERELVNTFFTRIDPANCIITPDPIEIDESRFWNIAEIISNLGKNIFTPNFESEFELLRKHFSL